MDKKIGCVQHDCDKCAARARLDAALALQLSERISVLPADAPRTDWCGHMLRKRDKRKGCDSWCAYAPTPMEAIEAVYEEYLRSTAAGKEGA